MQSDRESMYRSEPMVFSYSLDWRFLVHLSNPDRVFVFFKDDPEFCQTLEQVGIPVTNQLSFLDIEHKPNKEMASLVFPFGLPGDWVSGVQADQVEFFRSMRKLMAEHGHVLVGFHNTRGYRSKPLTKYYASTPQKMASQLQQAGFRTIRVFGVLPDLNIPEYIFDLNARSMYFALQHRFKRKPLLANLLQLLSHTAEMTRLFDFLPCYFVVATV